MSLSRNGLIAKLRFSYFMPLSVICALPLAACREEAPVQEAAPRPVRTTIIEKSDINELVSLTGDIQAENEAILSFRIAGRIIERSVNVGDRVVPDQVLAKLDPDNELNSLRSAQAALTGAQGRLNEARNNFERQQSLLQRGFTTRVLFDQAKQVLTSSQSAVDDARAQLRTAEDRVSYTQLKADAAGSVVARGAETGEVVQAGQMIFRIARDGGLDAVFNVPAQVLRAAPPDPKITIALTDDPSVTASGRVRQVDPQADPVTRTFQVKVSLIDPPPAMRLGATVVGRMNIDSSAGISIPASALTESEGKPSVWVVDPAASTVSMRSVEIIRFDPGTVRLGEGLEPGDIVVTAGVQALHPGQRVRILGSSS